MSALPQAADAGILLLLLRLLLRPMLRPTPSAAVCLLTTLGASQMCAWMKGHILSCSPPGAHSDVKISSGLPVAAAMRA